MNKIKFTLTLLTLISLNFVRCTSNEKSTPELHAEVVKESPGLSYNGYGSIEEYGGHLVMIAGCHDCHTPKKMGPKGPELDMDLELSGHPAQMPAPNVNRHELESNGYVTTQTLTAWVGAMGNFLCC